jgi:hypothetical protein
MEKRDFSLALEMTADGIVPRDELVPGVPYTGFKIGKHKKR